MNKKKLNIVIFFFVCMYVTLGDYVIIKPQPIARSLTASQLEVVLAKSPTNSMVSIPVHLLVEKKGTIQENLIVEELKGIIADTRNNIAECKDMSDIEIASLYIRQMTKSAKEINVEGTSTIERIIGAGMREDIKKE